MRWLTDAIGARASAQRPHNCCVLLEVKKEGRSHHDFLQMCSELGGRAIVCEGFSSQAVTEVVNHPGLSQLKTMIQMAM